MIDTRPAETIFLPQGFSFSSICAGIKASGRPDLAFIGCGEAASAAAVFTRNRLAAAPVQLGRAFLNFSSGKVRAVVVNSGNANCATGKQGLAGCRAVCTQAAKLLRANVEQIFPSSTGMIGVPFPAEKILNNLSALICQTAASEPAARQFAAAIMTTDTRPKIASAAFRTRRGEVRLLGFAKGSGMIHPQLATMLAYIVTDIAASPAELRRLLPPACDESFNCVSVDGDTSTNDTVLLLASGKSGVGLNHATVLKKFQSALGQVCRSLAEQIVSDGEGVQHVIRLTIEQAKNRYEAMQVARAIAHSPLVKTAWAGADPNWGRILAAIGNSGIELDPNRVNIFIANQKVCQRGQADGFDERQAHRDLAQPVCNIRVQLGRGRAHLRFYSTDLSAEYVRINADYST